MKQKYIPLFIVLIGLVIGGSGTLCSLDKGCFLHGLTNEIIFTVIKPIRIYSYFAFVPALLALSIKEDAFRTWVRFVKWFVALSALFIILTATYPIGGGLDGTFPSFVPAKEDTARFMGIIFFVASLIIIGWKSLPTGDTKRS